MFGPRPAPKLAWSPVGPARGLWAILGLSLPGQALHWVKTAVQRPEQRLSVRNGPVVGRLLHDGGLFGASWAVLGGSFGAPGSQHPLNPNGFAGFVPVVFFLMNNGSDA